MKKFIFVKIRLIVCIILLLFSCFKAGINDSLKASNDNDKDEDTIQEALKMLKSPDWKTKDRAVENLRGKIEKQNVQDALISLLKKESARKEQWWRRKIYEEDLKPTLNEGRGEYYLNLLSVATKIKDKKVIPALIPGSICSIKVQQAIADFGKEAVSPLNESLNSSVNQELWIGALKTKVLLLGRVNVTEEQQIKLKQSILNKIDSDNAYVRIAASEALAELGDTSVLPVLRQLKDNDPYEWKKKRDGREISTFPVRESAAKAIRKLSGE